MRCWWSNSVCDVLAWSNNVGTVPSCGIALLSHCHEKSLITVNPAVGVGVVVDCAFNKACTIVFMASRFASVFLLDGFRMYLVYLLACHLTSFHVLPGYGQPDIMSVW